MALRCIVELRESQAIGGQGIEMGCLDLGTVAPEVGEPEIVGHDKHNVGFLRRQSARQAERSRDEAQ